MQKDLLRPSLLNFFWCKQRGVFQEATEFLFADEVMGSLASGEVFEGLVFHFQSFQMEDEEIKVALIPNLALL